MSSQARQDDFVLSLIDKGYFLDVGCYLPDKFNNSIKLEQNGWVGIAVDIKDYSKEWEDRSTPFIHADALTCDWSVMLWPGVIDYLSLDIEGMGNRFKALKRLVEVREFKIITIEHDRYRDGHMEAEAIPQRWLLTALGYHLLCKDVISDTRPFEDWWVNQKYVSGYEHYQSNGMQCDAILKFLDNQK